MSLTFTDYGLVSLRAKGVPNVALGTFTVPNATLGTERVSGPRRVQTRTPDLA